MNYLQDIEAFYQRLIQDYPEVRAAVCFCFPASTFRGDVPLTDGGGYEGVAAVYLVLKNRTRFLTNGWRDLINLWESIPVANEFLRVNFREQLHGGTQRVTVSSSSMVQGRIPLMEVLMNRCDTTLSRYRHGDTRIHAPAYDEVPPEPLEQDPQTELSAQVPDGPTPVSIYENLVAPRFGSSSRENANGTWGGTPEAPTYSWHILSESEPNPAYQDEEPADYCHEVLLFEGTSPETPTPTDDSSEFYLRSPYGGTRQASQIPWDLRDPHERERHNVVPLITGGYASGGDTTTVAAISPDGGYELGMALYTEAAGSYFAAVHGRGRSYEPNELIVLINGADFVGSPPPGWMWVDGTGGESYLFPDRFGMTEVADPARTGRVVRYPTTAVRLLSNVFGRLFDRRDDDSSRPCLRTRTLFSLPSNILVRGRNYYAQQYCNRCRTNHDLYAFTAQCAEAQSHRRMSLVQGYHGFSTINVYAARRASRTAGRLHEYTIGFEVEKNHVVNLDGTTAGDRGHYVDNTPLFSRWERDGSCGIEGITHAYSVDRYRLFKSHVMRSRHLLDGGVDRLRGPDREDDNRRRYTCGGHVTLVGPKVCMNSVRRYAGLLYSLYKKRLRNGFCADNKDLGDTGRSMHYCAIREREQRNSVEFRLVRRVETHANLLWRFRLFRKLAKAIETDMTFSQFLSECRPLLNEVFNKNKVREILADAKHFDDFINRGYIHSRIREFI